LKGEQFGTIEKSPNTELFDAVNPAALGTRSTLLKRRLELQEEKSARTAPQITTNINIPPEIIALFCPTAPAPLPTVPAPALAAANPPVPMLIPAHLVPGPNLGIDDFHRTYDLDDDIRDRFKRQKFRFTDTFRYVELSDLNKMEFFPGEIAELKVTIAAWARQPTMA
jgi:hypothetical protein